MLKNHLKKYINETNRILDKFSGPRLKLSLETEAKLLDRDNTFKSQTNANLLNDLPWLDLRTKDFYITLFSKNKQLLEDPKITELLNDIDAYHKVEKLKQKNLLKRIFFLLRIIKQSNHILKSLNTLNTQDTNDTNDTKDTNNTNDFAAINFISFIKKHAQCKADYLNTIRQLLILSNPYKLLFGGINNNKSKKLLKPLSYIQFSRTWAFYDPYHRKKFNKLLLKEQYQYEVYLAKKNNKYIPGFLLWLEDKDELTCHLKPGRHVKGVRSDLRVEFKDGQIYWKNSVANSSKNPNEQFIYAIDENENMYIGVRKPTAVFNSRYNSSKKLSYDVKTHAEFLVGRPVIAAGKITIKNGKVVNISCESGHYEQPNYKFTLQAVELLFEKKAIAENCLVVSKIIGNNEKLMIFTEMLSNIEDVSKLKEKLNTLHHSQIRNKPGGKPEWKAISSVF